MGILEGVRVIDMASLWASPLASAYLADQGADVIKLEPPWGDEARRLFTQRPIAGGEGRSFLMTGRGKRGIAVDITRPEGKEIVHRLARTADVLLHNFRLGVAESLGFDYDALRRLNPRLIYVQTTPYGVEGPYAKRRGYDRLIQALAGIMGRRKLADGTPIGTGGGMVDMVTPLAVAYGIGLALYHRERTGRSQRVDVSMLHVALAMQVTDLVRVEREDPAADMPKDLANQPAWAPYRCADGLWVVIGAVSDKDFQALCAALDVSHLATDARFATTKARAQNRDDLYNVLEGLFATRPRDQWLAAFERFDVPGMPVLEQDEVFQHPQVQANKLITETTHPVAGRVSFVSPFPRLSEAAPAVSRPAPLLGQHTDEVLRELGYDANEIDALRRGGIIK